MTWSKWKQGLIVSVLSGIFTGAVGLGIDMSVKAIIVMMVVNIAKDGLLYITNHPVDAIDNAAPPAPPSKP